MDKDFAGGILCGVINLDLKAFAADNTGVTYLSAALSVERSGVENERYALALACGLDALAALDDCENL